MAWLLPQSWFLGGIDFDVHSLLYASLAIVVGFQSMTFWVFAKVYGMREFSGEGPSAAAGQYKL
jgi:hypothetical protein